MVFGKSSGLGGDSAEFVHEDVRVAMAGGLIEADVRTPASGWSRKKVLAVLGGIGAVAVVGLVAGTSGNKQDSESSSGSGSTDSTDTAAGTVFQFSSSSFGEFATLAKYQDVADGADYPEGTVTLTPGNRFSWSLSGLEGSASGGIHIHANSDCGAPGGHHWDSVTFPSADPWVATKWVSDADGGATGGFDVDELAGAFGFDANSGHVVVVHDASGAKVACGVLGAYSTDEVEVKAKLALYPEMEWAAPPQGSITLSSTASTNVFSWDLYDLEPSTTGGVHAHVGYSCETAGGHLFSEGAADYWTAVQWESDASGVSQGSVDLSEFDEAVSFEEHLQRTVVVHWANGSRAACGELAVVDKDSDGEDTGDMEMYRVKAKLLRYPGGPAQHPSGKAIIDTNNVVTLALEDLVPGASYSWHLHEGKSCDSSGGHYYRMTAAADPWNGEDTTVVGGPNGKAYQRVDVDTLPGAHPSIANLDQTLVLHDSAGTRVACGQFRAHESFGVKAAPLQPYPGFEGSHVTGRVTVDSSNTLIYELAGSPEQNVFNGLHIHEGSSCSLAGGHHFEGAVDGWNGDAAKVWIDETGRALGMIDLTRLEGAYAFEHNVGRVVVVHDSSGQRVSCQELLPYVFHLASAKDEVEEREADFTVSAKMRRYPVFKGNSRPRGRAYLNSEGIFSWKLFNLLANTEGYAIHIHTGSSKDCASSAGTGGHFFKPDEEDGWLTTTFATNDGGKARGVVDLRALAGAYPFAANLNRCVTVHAPGGERIGAAHLAVKSDFGVMGGFGPYGGATASDDTPSGTAFLSRKNKLSVLLYNLEPEASGGLHIHALEDCDNAGPHYFMDGAEDLWGSVQYSSDSRGMARVVVDVDAYEGFFGFADNVDKAVVIHSSSGARVGCTTLSHFVLDVQNELEAAVMTQEELEDYYNADDVSGDEDTSDEFAVRATMARYKDLGAGDAWYRGKVVLSADNVLAYSFKNVPEGEFSMHIHAGTSCADDGPHFYAPGSVDGWIGMAKPVANSDGVAQGFVDVASIEGAYPFAANLNRVVVLHSSDGTKVSCGELGTGQRFGVKGRIGAYPGSALASPSGGVFLSKKNVFSFSLRGLPAMAVGGVHIHSGVGREACDDASSVGGHWWTSDVVAEDFWKAVKWASDSAGHATGSINLDDEPFAFSFEDNADHAVVVHGPDGARIGCAVLANFKLGKTAQILF